MHLMNWCFKYASNELYYFPTVARPQPLVSSLHGGAGERTGKVEMRKVLGWYKDSLIDNTKAVNASKAKLGIHSFSVSHWQADVQALPVKHGFSSAMIYWEDKYSHFRCSPALLPSSTFIAEPYSMKYPFGQPGSSVLVPSPPSTL